MSGFYSMKVKNAVLQLLYMFMFSFEARPPYKQTEFQVCSENDSLF